MFTHFIDLYVFWCSTFNTQYTRDGSKSWDHETLLHRLKIKQHIDYKILSHVKSPYHLSIFVSVQPHRGTCSSDVVTVSRPPSSSSLKVNNRSFRHALTHHLVSGISFPRNFACLHFTKTYHSHLISHMSVRLLLHHHCHHPLLLSSTPGSKLIFSTNPFLHSSSTFHLPEWLHGLQLFSQCVRSARSAERCTS